MSKFHGKIGDLRKEIWDEANSEFKEKPQKKPLKPCHTKPKLETGEDKEYSIPGEAAIILEGYFEIFHLKSN